jgi:hypothetical protein
MHGFNCPLWPFRMGTNPWRAPKTEAQRGIGFKTTPIAADTANLAGEIEEVPMAMTGATGPAMVLPRRSISS